MNFENDFFKLFKGEFEKQKENQVHSDFWKYTKPLIEEAYHVFLLTSKFSDYIKNNKPDEAEQIINWWFVKLDYKEKMDVAECCRSFELANEARKLSPLTEAAKYDIAQDKILEFYLLIKLAFETFDTQASKAQLNPVSLDRQITRYCKFIKANPDFFELILSAKTEDAEDLAAFYCNEIKEIGQNTPLDLIINGWRAEKRKDKQQ
mgnify:CR=1 FL=1|tara:strand:- start:173 stop:790 length:618 start_codon:yes stop_codon:yes gene_type:complete